MQSTSAVLLLGFPGLVCAYFAFRSFRNFVRTYFAPLEWVKETKDESVPYPPNSEALVATLEGFGFHSIGSNLTKLRYLPQPTQQWNFTNETGDTFVGFIPIAGVKPFFVGFMSYFLDRAMIMTTYPRGERVQTPMFHGVHAKYNLDAAFQYHQERLNVWRQTHGEPIISGSLQDSDPLNQTIYQRFYRRRHQRRLWLVSLTHGIACSVLAFGCAMMIIITLSAAPIIASNGDIVYNVLPEWAFWAIRFTQFGIGLSVLMVLIIRAMNPAQPIDSPPPRSSTVRGQHPPHTIQAAPPY